jgi:sugar phosphate isomerase/epimerase
VHLKAVRRPGAVERMIQRARRHYRMEAAAPGNGDGLDGFVEALSAHGYRGLLAIEDEGTAARAACSRRGTRAPGAAGRLQRRRAGGRSCVTRSRA